MAVNPFANEKSQEELRREAALAAQKGMVKQQVIPATPNVDRAFPKTTAANIAGNEFARPLPSREERIRGMEPKPFSGEVSQEELRRQAAEAQAPTVTGQMTRDEVAPFAGEISQAEARRQAALAVPPIEPAPEEIKPEEGVDSIPDGLIAPVGGPEEEIKTGDPEVENEIANKQKENSQKEIDRLNKIIEDLNKRAETVEGGTIQERDIIEEKRRADQALLNKEAQFNLTSNINDSIIKANKELADFDARMIATRGPDALSKPSVMRARDTILRRIAQDESRKAAISQNLSDATAAIDSFYTGELSSISANESSFNKLLQMADEGLIELSDEQKAQLESRFDVNVNVKNDIEKRKEVAKNAAANGNVYDRAVRDFNFSLEDDSEEMLRKLSKAEDEQTIINGFISKFPTAGITQGMSLADATTKIKELQPDRDIEIITGKDGTIFEYDNETGSVRKLVDAPIDSGSFTVNKDGALVKTKQRTSDQAKAFGFAERMDGAAEKIVDLWDEMSDGDKVAAFSIVPNVLKSEKVQQFEQVASEFISAQLRRESGAAISKDEFKKAEKTYIPKFGDKEGTIANKKQSMEGLTDSMYTQAGGRDEITQQSPKQRIIELKNSSQENSDIIKQMIIEGLSDEDILQVFDPSFSVSGSSEGTATDIEKLSQAIAEQESGGNYKAIGPKTAKGNQAYGKYQVMDFNIPVWTKQVLGKSMTPREFLNDPEAQDKVAVTKMNETFNKYGTVQDVASVWFSGKPINKAGSVSDVTGTTVPQYVENVVSIFNRLS
jgi:hypothetical protein